MGIAKKVLSLLSCVGRIATHIGRSKLAKAR